MRAIDIWRISSTVNPGCVVQVLVLTAQRGLGARTAGHGLHHRSRHTLLPGEVVESCA
jgi:hypothetical protein